MRTRLLMAAVVALASAGLVVAPSTPVAATVADDDWRGIVNAYRSMSGLGPVGENPTWSAQAFDHSCYMLLNGISHDEDPTKPGYTEGGHTAGMNGNVAVSSSAGASIRSHIDLWMTGPFHAIGILRHNLTSSGFGICANPDTSPWRSGATLDVLRGIDGTIPRPAAPIVFPGRDVVVPLDRFITEYPNPVTMCGWTGPAGLPLIAMMPSAVSSASSSLTGPNGPVETCTLHPGNTSSEPTARAVLDSENAVVVVPREPLATGTYTATASSNGGEVTWSFGVDPNAPLSDVTNPTPAPAQPTGGSSGPQAVPTTSVIGDESIFVPVTPYRHADSRTGLRVGRLTAGAITPVEIAGADVTAVSANFTVTGQTAPGHLRVFNCSVVAPEVSTVNFTDRPAATQALVPLTSGSLCLYASVDTDVIIDVNGLLRAPGGTDVGTSTYVPVSPSRIYDTRGEMVPRLAPGEVRPVQVAAVAGGAPAGADAVALNITAVDPAAAGWLRAFPCDAPGGSDVSNVNFGPGETRPNSAIVPVAADGRICLEADVGVDVIVDIGGHFTSGGGYEYTALEPIRILDTRSTSPAINTLTAGNRLAPGQVGTLRIAGAYGIPSDARAVTLNITAVDPAAPGYLTAYPCSAVPASSNVNFRPEDLAVANGAMVGLSGAGEVCFVADQHVHVLLDVSGVWR